jgi:hypothetical protein
MVVMVERLDADTKARFRPHPAHLLHSRARIIVAQERSLKSNGVVLYLIMLYVRRYKLDYTASMQRASTDMVEPLLLGPCGENKNDGRIENRLCSRLYSAQGQRRSSYTIYRDQLFRRNLYVFSRSQRRWRSVCTNRHRRAQDPMG